MPQAEQRRVTFDEAHQKLLELHQRAVSEQRHGRVSIELVYRAGKLDLIEEITRFTTKAANN